MPEHHDPFAPAADASTIRPRPGGRPRSRLSGAPSPTRRPRWSSGADEPPPLALPQLSGASLNPLVEAANPLLWLAGRLRGATSAPDVEQLRRQASGEIRRFGERAHTLDIQRETTTAARYALCATVDEAVLSTPWGAHSTWGEHTLLVEFHGEAIGGERFFEVLRGLAKHPAKHLHLVELYYLCLALGFTGQYGLVPKGHDQLVEIRHRLYRRIRAERGDPPSRLSRHWRGLEDRRNPLMRYGLWWTVPAALWAGVLFALISYQWQLGLEAGIAAEHFAKLGLESTTESRVPESVTGLTLKEALEGANDTSTLTVEERGGRTTVTLGAAGLFALGRAELMPDHERVLRAIAVALNQVPGDVTVLGHTDSSRPTRDARYTSNQALSEARADYVAGVLRRHLDDDGRVVAVGMGASLLLVQPGTAPENRRVEIIHAPPRALSH